MVNEVPTKFGEHLLHALWISDVALERTDLPPHRPDLRAEGFRLVMAVVIVDGHVTAGGRELVRDGPADPTGATGDEGDLPGEGAQRRSFLASRPTPLARPHVRPGRA